MTEAATSLPRRRHPITLLHVALVLALGAFAIAPFGYGQVGQPAADLIETLDLVVDSPDHTPDDAAVEAATSMLARTPGGLELALETRGRALHTVRGAAVFDDDTLLASAAAIAAATGYFEGIEAPVAEYLRQNLPGLAGTGPRTIRVEAFDLTLDVTGDTAPHDVAWSVALAEVPDAAFPPARHALGPADARYVIREFSDLQCPFCARYALDTMPTVQAELLSRGDVRFEYHHFPLQASHPNAFPAAEAAECVTDANPDDEAAFWTYTDALFERQQAWSSLSDPGPYFARLPGQVGLAGEGVAACLDDGTHTAAVASAYDAAVRLGVSATPTVFVGPYRLASFNTLAGYLEAFERIDAFAADE